MRLHDDFEHRLLFLQVEDSYFDAWIRSLMYTIFDKQKAFFLDRHNRDIMQN